MQEWTNFDDIKSKLLRLWKKGDILTKSDLFPLTIKLKGPNSKCYGTHFLEISNWVKGLKNKDINSIGYGYEVVEKEINLRLVGKNTVPTHVIIKDLNDATKLIKKQKELHMFLKNKEALFDEWEQLEEWICKYPFKVLESIGVNCHKYIKVVKWFEQNPNHNVYIRQFDIPGIDTKFIEKNKVVLTEILNAILPENQINEEAKRFEERFYIKAKPANVRFRILNEANDYDFTDMSVPLEEFVNWRHDFENVFFTENEINFLSFPNVEKSIIIFARGYGVDNFKNVKWLLTKKLYYWGDIDTHGFNILSRARSFLPHLESFLMTEEILLTHKDLWVSEDKQFLYEVKNLRDDEYELLYSLQNNTFGHRVRLEQERISYRHIQEAIKDIC